MESLHQDNQPVSFEEWCTKCNQLSPHFKFWHTPLQLELLVLTYVRSLQTVHYPLYTDSLIKLAPWFFALDDINCAWWVQVHVRDIINLSDVHQQIASEIISGNFTVHKTRRVLSLMRPMNRIIGLSRVMVELLVLLNRL